MEKIPQKNCLLHPLGESGATEGEVMKFNKDHWSQAISAKNRRSSQKRSKHLAVCDRLPETFSSAFLYHRQCYKNFTACRNLPDLPGEPCSSTSGHGALLLRSSIESLSSAESTSGIFKKEYIFCKKVGKRHSKLSGSSYEYLASCETLNAENNIKEAACVLEGKEMEVLIAGVNFVAKEVKHHNTCKNAYIKKAERQKKEKEATDYGKVRQAHQEAFCKITHYVQSEIISADKEETLVNVHKKDMDIFSESTGSDSSYPARNLMEKLQDNFKDSLVCVISSRKEGYILKTSRAQSSEIENDVSRISRYIRNGIKSVSHELKSPQNLTAEDILSNYNISPSIPLNFLRILLTGDSATADEKQGRRIESLSDDIVFAVTSGLVKPQKQLLLGLGVKSMTGSKKVSLLGTLITITCLYSYVLRYKI